MTSECIICFEEINGNFDERKFKIITNQYAEFINWCHQNTISASVQSQFNDCIKFMNEDDYHAKYWPVFISETKQLDEMRNENYSEVTTKQ